MLYLWQWHCLFSTYRQENDIKMNCLCTVCRELYFQTIQEGSLGLIFVCAHEYICLLPFGTSCAFSIWRYKNSWGTRGNPRTIGISRRRLIWLCPTASEKSKKQHDNTKKPLKLRLHNDCKPTKDRQLK